MLASQVHKLAIYEKIRGIIKTLRN